MPTLACEGHAGGDYVLLMNAESVLSTELGTQEVFRECEKECMKVLQGCVASIAGPNA